MGKRILGISVILVLSAVLAAQAQVAVGEEMPNFTHTSLGDEELRLSDHRGKVVFIYFFAAKCEPCIANGPNVQSNIYQKFADDTNFVAIGLEVWNLNKPSVQDFKNATGVSFPIGMKAEQTIAKVYGVSFYERLVVVDPEGTLVYKGSGKASISEIEKAEETIKGELENTFENESNEQPRIKSLHQNYPNPFNPTTTIRYELSTPTRVQLDIYTILGEQIRTLVDDFQTVGMHTVEFTAQNDLPSGMYFYRLKAGSATKTRTMTLIK